jgi:hypothetical protein
MSGRAISAAAREILRGAYDLHIHTSPDVIARKLTSNEAVAQARAAGMAAIALKSHVMSTASAAASLNEFYPVFRAVSCLVLNSQVGGLNPWAVEAFGKMGGELLWFPTLDAENYVTWKCSTGANAPDRGMMRVTDEKGSLLLAAAAVLDLAAKYDLTVGTGHLSPEESVVLVHEAAARGVKRIWVTHVTLPCCAMSVAQMKECVSCGAMIEFSYGHVLHKQFQLDGLLSGLRTIGVENAVLTTDSGQANAPYPVDVLGEAIEVLLNNGFSSAEVDVLLKANPQKLLRRR